MKSWITCAGMVALSASACSPQSGEVATAYLTRVLRIAPLDHMRCTCATLAEARAWIAASLPAPSA